MRVPLVPQSTLTSQRPSFALSGTTHTFNFKDNGEAGINTGDTNSDYFTYGAEPTQSSPYYATAGNVQVHYSATVS